MAFRTNATASVATNRLAARRDPCGLRELRLDLSPNGLLPILIENRRVRVPDTPKKGWSRRQHRPARATANPFVRSIRTTHLDQVRAAGSTSNGWFKNWLRHQSLRSGTLIVQWSFVLNRKLLFTFLYGSANR